MLNLGLNELSEDLQGLMATRTVTAINMWLTNLTPKEKQAVRPQLEVLKRILETNLNEVRDKERSDHEDA